MGQWPLEVFRDASRSRNRGCPCGRLPCPRVAVRTLPLQISGGHSLDEETRGRAHKRGGDLQRAGQALARVEPH
eukprot:510161-Pyramimonas_sp.AAC.1